MLKCRDIAEIGSEYLDQAMPLHRRIAVRWHLRLCGACRNYLDQLRKTAGLLRLHPIDPPPPELESRLAAGAAAAKEPP